MFKNLILFKITTPWNTDIETAEQNAQAQKFVPCAPTQMTSSGWVEPRGYANGPLIESINGHWIMRLCIAKKILPSDVVNRATDEKVLLIEKNTGRKPGKKEKKEIKEEVIFTLLPQAFVKLEAVGVWIDLQQQMVIVDASSIGKCDNVITALVKTFENLGLNLLSTKESPTTCMSHWLLNEEAPGEFEIHKEVELRSSTEEKSSVKYGRHTLLIDEIKGHIRQGKLPIKLAMSWSERLSFTLTDTLAIKKLTILDIVTAENPGGENDAFDGDITIMTSELSALIPQLITALGGDLDFSKSEQGEEEAQQAV